MNCRGFDQWLDNPTLRGGGRLPPAAAEHLAECRECRDLLNWFSKQGGSFELTNSLQSKLIKTAAPDLTPVRPLAKPVPFLLVSGALLTALVALEGFLMGTTGLSLMNPSQMLGIGALLASSLVLLSRSLRLQMIPGASGRFSTTLLGLSIIAILAASMVILFPWHPSADFIPQGLSCWTPGMMLALPAALGLVWVARRGVFLSPDLAGGTIGLLAAASALMTIQLRCVLLEASHLLVWHAGVLLGWALLGFLAGRVFSLIPFRP